MGDEVIVVFKDELLRFGDVEEEGTTAHQRVNWWSEQQMQLPAFE